jgi:hypothetical protein
MRLTDRESGQIFSSLMGARRMLAASIGHMIYDKLSALLGSISTRPSVHFQPIFMEGFVHGVQLSEPIQSRPGAYQGRRF